MAFEAQFRSGNPTVVDYKPAAGNVAAGQVVLLGNLAGLANGIAHLDITNNALGALAVGEGVYKVTSLTTATAYAKAFWDDAVNKVTTTSTNMSPFGYYLAAVGAANTTVDVLHHPKV